MDAAAPLYPLLGPSIEAVLCRVLRGRPPELDDLKQTTYERVIRTLRAGNFKGRSQLAAEERDRLLSAPAWSFAAGAPPRHGRPAPTFSFSFWRTRCKRVSFRDFVTDVPFARDRQLARILGGNRRRLRSAGPLKHVQACAAKRIQQEPNRQRRRGRRPQKMISLDLSGNSRAYLGHAHLSSGYHLAYSWTTP